MARYTISPSRVPNPDWQRIVSQEAGVKIVSFGRTLTVEATPEAMARLSQTLGTSCVIDAVSPPPPAPEIRRS